MSLFSFYLKYVFAIVIKQPRIKVYKFGKWDLRNLMRIWEMHNFSFSGGTSIKIHSTIVKEFDKRFFNLKPRNTIRYVKTLWNPFIWFHTFTPSLSVVKITLIKFNCSLVYFGQSSKNIFLPFQIYLPPIFIFLLEFSIFLLFVGS